MKNRKIGIRWKIFMYLLAFVAILLALLWLMQIVYLNTFYKGIKKNELQQVCTQLLKSAQSGSLSEAMEEAARKSDLEVLLADMQGSIMESAPANGRFALLTAEMFGEYLQAAREGGGSAQIEMEGDVRGMDPSQYEKAQPPHDEGPGRFMMPFDMRMGAESIVALELLKWNGEEALLIVRSLVTPIDATVQTLRVQFVCIALILFLLSLLIALFMAKKISRPIVEINSMALEMGKGNYDVRFPQAGYKEISELGTTLNHTAAELKKAERIQQELIANVSHDLRTPLTMIIAYAEAIQDLPEENTAENLQVVIDEGKRLTALENDLLELSKLQSGAESVRMQTYDLTESIQAVLKRYAKLVEQEGYEIRFEYGSHVWIRADEYKIYQVIYNFINNAIHYTGDNKKVVVRQMLIPDRVRIEVEDYGEGIKEEDLPYIWERYYKVDKAHKRSVNGSGLGLSIVKNILILHGADYGVKSSPGEGSIFWFELPLAEI